MQPELCSINNCSMSSCTVKHYTNQWSRCRRYRHLGWHSCPPHSPDRLHGGCSPEQLQKCTASLAKWRLIHLTVPTVSPVFDNAVIKYGNCVKLSFDLFPFVWEAEWEIVSTWLKNIPLLWLTYTHNAHRAPHPVDVKYCYQLQIAETEALSALSVLAHARCDRFTPAVSFVAASQFLVHSSYCYSLLTRLLSAADRDTRVSITFCYRVEPFSAGIQNKRFSTVATLVTPQCIAPGHQMCGRQGDNEQGYGWLHCRYT